MAHALTDHERIQEWAEARGGVPACVRGTGRAGDPGILRLDLPGGAGNESLQRISWDDWFRKFDAQRLALLIDDADRPSTFNKLVNRAEVNVDVNPAPRKRGAASKESDMPNPNRQPNRERGAAAGAEDADPRRDDLHELSDDDADDLDDEAGEDAADDEEFDQTDADDEDAEDEEDEDGEDEESGRR